MRTLVPLFIATAVSLASFALIAQGPPPGGGKGKGKARENLKVLPDDANLVPTMQMFVAALGLADKGGCNYCHDSNQGASKASDANPKKLTARMMITMAKTINSNFPDGKEHVTCYTCHRGTTAPLTAAP
jgi:photosynthetic reaction center cytochrome c subunit